MLNFVITLAQNSALYLCRLWSGRGQLRAESCAARGAGACIELRPGLELRADRLAVADSFAHARPAAQPRAQGPGARVIDLHAPLPPACRLLFCSIDCVRLFLIQTMIYEGIVALARALGVARSAVQNSRRKTCLQFCCTYHSETNTSSFGSSDMSELY